MRYLFFVMSFFLSFHLFAQKDVMEREPVRLIVISNDSIYIKAHIWMEDGQPEPETGYTYHWYSDRRLHTTESGYSGELLHGLHESFYQDTRNLKSKGHFRYGLKDGTWKFWYPDGNLKKMINWKNGYRHGPYSFYNEEGQVIEEGNYKNGELHGTHQEYNTRGDLTSQTEYNKGERVGDEKAKESWFKRFWKKLQFWNKNEIGKDEE